MHLHRVPLEAKAERAVAGQRGGDIVDEDVRFVQGDVRPVHAAVLAASGGRTHWVVGGGDLCGQFHDAGLLDELIVQVASVTLGRGEPLFLRRLMQPPLRLESVRQLGTGFAELRYSVPQHRTATGRG